MKNKILLSLICGGLVLGLATGCGNQTNNENNNNNNIQNNGGTNQNNQDNKLKFTEEYTYFGFTFYYPNELATVQNNHTGYLLNDYVSNFYGGAYISKQKYEGNEGTTYYMTAISSPFAQMTNAEVKNENITLDNIVEKSKEKLIKSFGYYSTLMGDPKGNQVYSGDLNQVISKQEKITINGINMVKVEGYFEDTNRNLIGQEKFVAYYMIANIKDTDGSIVNLPVYYLGFGVDSDYNEVKSYMEESIKYIKKN